MSRVDAVELLLACIEKNRAQRDGSSAGEPIDTRTDEAVMLAIAAALLGEADDTILH